VMFFIESTKSETLKKNIKYGMMLFFAYILLNFVTFWLFSGWLWLTYILISWYFGYKAYHGEKIEIEYLDDLEKKVKDKM
jgi:uncharacterized membrane protein